MERRQAVDWKCQRSTTQGLPLIEVLVALTIVAILATVAYPAYRDQVIKSQRSAAKATLLNVASRLEQYYIDHKSYTRNLNALGYPAAVLHLSSEGSLVPPGSDERIYTIQVEPETNGCPLVSCYVLAATPVGNQTDDTTCGTLTLTSDGRRDASGSDPDNCW